MSLTKAEILKEALSSLETIIAEKTNKEYAHTSIYILLKKLEHKFGFLNVVSITINGYAIDQKINESTRRDICKAVEAFIRIVYMDLKDDAGIFFLRQIESKTKPGFIEELRINDVDFELLKIEHHVLFRNLNKLKLDIKNTKSMKNNIHKSVQRENDFLIKLDKVEKDLLKILEKQDVCQEEIIRDLNISHSDFNMIISRLLDFEFLQYLNDDEVSLTEKGYNYIRNYRKTIIK